MTIALWILSVPLIAEWVMAPVNLWTGRTMPLFTKFTGFSPAVARRGFAPVKLVAAGLLAAGLAYRPLSIAGAALTIAICAVYLARLAAPGRRAPDGIAAFTLFGALALALLLLSSLT
jgi:hypothetical protein